ncbi:DNA-directed RNA polymerase II subunit RPB9 [Cladobotryum mycophilum]|uniref:DNA-directed RNA polymerase II subunit RPB9 n=1 Tax=Cladobotryum mycophilum TaxID=491253 RepID=A0ABR0SC86_9HYPO
MATPQSTASYEASGPKKLEQITFRFCSECSNMLYPKEDEDSHKLQFTCRTCQYTEDAQSTCVFRNVLNNSSGETAGVTQDVGSDPTVSEVPPVLCLGCGVIIYCITCGSAASEVCLAPSHDDELESMGLCQFVLPWGDEDPFDEYDEELMEDVDPSAGDSSDISDSHSYTSEEFCDDGAMVIDI